jgi:hypothetical protein
MKIVLVFNLPIKHVKAKPQYHNNVDHVGALTGENRRISVDTVATMLNIGVGSVYDITHETQISLCSRWVPRQLSDEQKLKRAELQSFRDTLPC